MPEEICKVCGKEALCKEGSGYVCKYCGSRFDSDGNTVCGMPENFLELVDTAAEYEENHRCVREINALMDALEIVPDNAAVMVKIGRAYRDSNLLDRSLDYYKRAAEADPLYPQCYINIGVVLSAKLRYQEACTYFKKALSLLSETDPDYAVVLGNYSFALAKAGDREGAVRMLALADENGYQSCDIIRKTFNITVEETNRVRNENMS